MPPEQLHLLHQYAVLSVVANMCPEAAHYRHPDRALAYRAQGKTL